MPHSPETGQVSSELRALNISFATATFAPDGSFLRANSRFLRLFGYDFEDIAGQTHASLLGANAETGDLEALWESLRRGETEVRDHLCKSGSGADVWLKVRYTPLTGADGDVTEVVAIANDISERTLQTADDRGQVLAIHRSQAVIHFDLQGRILEANDIFLNTLGYSREEVIGQHHHMFVRPDERESAEYAAFWSDLAAGKHKAGEYCRIGKDGREVWLQATYTPIVDPTGRPFKVVKYAVETTSERLRRADYQWQIAAIEKSQCVITFDMHGTILDANQLFLDAVGYTLDEIQGRHHRMFVEPAYSHGTEYSSFWRELESGRHHSGRYRRLGKGGREIWLQATYNPIFDMAGNPVKVVKYATVVTEAQRKEAEHQGQIAAIHSAQCVVSFSLDGKIIDANDNFLDATGYKLAEVRGQHHRMFVDPSEAESSAYKDFWASLAGGEYRSGEYKRLGKHRRELWLQATYNPIFDLNGRPFMIVKYATDVTAEKIRQADDRGQIEAINKSQGVVTLALDGTILDMNDNILGALGYSRDEIVGQPHASLVDPGEVHTDAYREFWAKLRSGTFHSGMYKRRGKGGREIWLQATYNPILGLNGEPVKVIKIATDVTRNVALAEAFEDAKRQAQHDSATSLPNRVRLANFMTGHLVHPASRLVVFYMDLDRFKPINDTFGHHIGDRVLGEVADRLRRALSADQLVARVGGDEFVIAAPDMPDDAIEPFCLSLLELVRAPIHHDEGDINIGLSIGIAMSPADGTAPDELLRRADAALYRSKQNGRGSYSFFAAEMNDRIIAQRNLAEDMRRGIAAGEFFLEYQPRFDTGTKSVKSLEALVRWSHPERGRMSPAEFIPLAERSGLIVPLGDWILRNACRQAVQWGSAGVSVNVSPIQFRDGDLFETVRTALAESGLPGGRLELELTEGVLMADAERALGVLEKLKSLGVKLAMDDFGTGYSSLSYLRNFPFDVIKIDRRFISDLESRDSARAIVQAILGLGKALGLSVTAEGVETRGQYDMLATDQCNEVQGFLLARPLQADKVRELLAGLSEAADQPARDGADPAALQEKLEKTFQRPKAGSA